MAEDQGSSGKWKWGPLPHVEAAYRRIEESESKAIDLWVEYYYETETFDRTLPHVRTPRDGRVQIFDPESNQKSRDFAKRVQHRLMQAASGMSLEILDAAKKRVLRLSFKELTIRRARKLGKEMDHLSYGEKICAVFDALCERHIDRGASPSEVTNEMAARGWLSPYDTVIDIEELMQGLRREGRL